MTKNVRIENACTAPYPVRVTVQHKNDVGEWVDAPAVYQKGGHLDFPTAQGNFMIHSGQRLVIDEQYAEQVVHG